MHRWFTIWTLAGLAAFAQNGQDWLNQGVQLYKAAKYGQAVEAFRRAVDLDPASATAHLYLGTAYMTQWIPGADSPEHMEFARQARMEFETVVRLNPRDLVAMQSLASLAYNQSMGKPAEKTALLDEAAMWYRRVLAADPKSKEAYYSLGVIAWSKFYPEFGAARARLGMKPEDPGPISNRATRQDLQTRFGGVIEEGIRNLQQALAIDPDYDDAMAYLNLLVRERADLRESAAEYQRDIQAADEWVQKALDTKRTKAARQRGPMLPPERPANAAVIEIQPAGEAAPASALGSSTIRVGKKVLESNRIVNVDPVYPDEARRARIQGVVTFEIAVGKEGQVRHAQLLSGHPLLVPAALEAVKQWRYKPVLLNGEPVEVVSEVEVPFLLPE